MRINGKLLCAICVTAVTVLVVNAREFRANGDENKADVAPNQDEQACHISLYLANRFHLAVVARMMLNGPDEIELELQYDGILRIDSGRKRGQRLHGSIGAPLQWTIQVKDELPVFAMTVSDKRTPNTRVVCKVEKERVFVEVCHIQGVVDITDEEIKKKRASLGNRSVHDMLILLEGPAAEIETAPTE